MSLTYLDPDTSRTEGKYEKGSTSERIKKQDRKTEASQDYKKEHHSAIHEVWKKKHKERHTGFLWRPRKTTEKVPLNS